MSIESIRAAQAALKKANEAYAIALAACEGYCMDFALYRARNEAWTAKAVVGKLKEAESAS